MNILLKQSGGPNIILRPQARLRWYPTATAPAARAEVWWRYANKPNSTAQLIGIFALGEEIKFPFNPDADEDIVLLARSLAADGTPNVSTLDDAVQTTIIFQRETEAPTVGQVGASTTEQITLGVDGFTRFARKRKIRIADNEEMTDASVTIRDSESYVTKELPRYIDIFRAAMLVASFTWDGNDPASNGFAKTGTGTTAASISPSGWRVTTATEAQTYYSKTSFPANAFQNGFTLEVTPPTVVSTDAAVPAQCVGVRVEDGSKRYELTFDADELKLNGGASHAHAGAQVRLVVAAGGAHADLWIGDTKVENDTAGAATATSGLHFGDLAGTDDAEAVWSLIEYALTPQDPALAQTIFVGISHSSGGSFGAESTIQSFSFASEAGTGGSEGDFDPIPRDNLNL